MKYVNIVLTVFFLIGFHSITAQQTIAVSGGNAAGNGGTVSYTIGQINYNCYSTVAGTIIEGCQQPYEIFVVTDMRDAEKIRIEIYPNPVTDYLRLVLTDYPVENLSYSLFGNSGERLADKKITGIETVIDMQNLPPGAYFLSVHDNQKDVKTFKIIKNR